MDEGLLRPRKKKKHKVGLHWGIWGNQKEAPKGGLPAGIDWAFPLPRIRAVSLWAYFLILGGKVAISNTQRLDDIFSFFVTDFRNWSK